MPLLRVVARLVAANPTQKLSLVVAGSAFEDSGRVLREHAAVLGIGRHLTVVDVVDPLDAHVWFTAADVFVSPVDNAIETFGITPIEAMACGTPQVVSDWSGYRDTVVDGETGFLVPTRRIADDHVLDSEAELIGDSWEVGFKRAQVTVVDLEVMQDRIQCLIDNEELRCAMGKASRRRAEEMFSWEVVTKMHVELWDHLRQSAAFEQPSSAYKSYIRPRTTACFGHFATAQLAASTRLLLTDEGEAVSDVVVTPMLHRFLRDYIQVETLIAIAMTLKAYSNGTMPGMTLSALRDARGDTDGLAGLRLERHVLWMAKQGFLKMNDAQT